MSNQPLDKELDPTPLVNAIIEKTKAGRLKWEATANPSTFIASVGGNTTLRIQLETTDEVRYEQVGPVSNPPNRIIIPETLDRRVREVQVPVLSLLDDKGRTLWEISNRDVMGNLDPLFRLARRMGNKLDERMEALMEVVQKL